VRQNQPNAAAVTTRLAVGCVVKLENQVASGLDQLRFTRGQKLRHRAGPESGQKFARHTAARIMLTQRERRANRHAGKPA